MTYEWAEESPRRHADVIDLWSRRRSQQRPGGLIVAARAFLVGGLWVALAGFGFGVMGLVALRVGEDGLVALVVAGLAWSGLTLMATAFLPQGDEDREGRRRRREGPQDGCANGDTGTVS